MITALKHRAGRVIALKMAGLASRLEAVCVADEFARVGVPDVDSIPTFTTRAELTQLYILAKNLPQGSCVVEIGSYLGASSCYIALGLRSIGGRLVCIDTWRNETMPDGARDTFVEFQRNVAPLATVVVTNRLNTADLIPEHLPAECRMAFVDGDHSYDAVKRDVEIVTTRIPGQGLLVFHDAIHFSGVSRTIGELLTSGSWVVAGHVENLVWLRRMCPSH